MSRNYYSEINMHFVWHTKLSWPMLTPEIELATHRHLKQKLVNLPGAFVHEIGGTENHVHLAVTLTPTLLISDLIGQVKGASSHEVNQVLGRGRKVLEWQTGYGVVSFGTKDLEWVISYIRNQREHHAKRTFQERLERITADESQAQALQREAP